MKKTIIALLCVGVLQGCGSGSSDAGQGAESRAYAIPDWEIPQPGVGLIELWRLELMKQDRLFDSAIGTRSLSDWAAFFTEDGVMIRTEVGEITGPAQIQGAIFEAAQARALTRLRWAPERAEVSSGGDMGYTVGSYWTTGEDDAGTEVSVSGKYVTIWRIQEDGTWLAEMTLGVPLNGPDPVPSAEGSGIIGLQRP